MGSACFRPHQKDKMKEILKISDKAFRKIDRRKNRAINKDDIENYFQAFSKSASKILLAQIDLNNDGFISRNQWIGYWQYIRRAGYDYHLIKVEIQRVLGGQLPWNSFIKARQYEPNIPREMVVDKIIQEIKSIPDLPIILQK